MTAECSTSRPLDCQCRRLYRSTNNTIARFSVVSLTASTLLMLLACSRARNSGSRSFLRCRSAASSARPSTPENMGLECFFTLPRPRCQPRRPTIKESARQTSHTTRPYPCPVPARISVSVRPHGGAPGFKRYQIGRFSPMWERFGVGTDASGTCPSQLSRVPYGLLTVTLACQLHSALFEA